MSSDFFNTSTIDCGRISAKAVLFARRKVLLLKKPNGKWDLPGGRVEPEETVFEGLRREILEETGFRLDSATFIGGWNKKGNTRGLQSAVAVFLGSIGCKPKQANISLSSEHIAGEFFSLETASGLALPKSHSKALRLASAHITF